MINAKLNHLFKENLMNKTINIKKNKVILFLILLILSFPINQAFPFAFIFAGENNGIDVVTHPIGYTGTGGILNISISIDPASPNAAAMVIPTQNVINRWNAMLGANNNLILGAANNVPVGNIDYESALLHELGHSLGLAHVNAATESGLPNADRNYTKATDGIDNTFNLNAGVDGIIGSADDIRGDDINLNYFRISNNNPFGLGGVIDNTSYSRDVTNLPVGDLFSANPDRNVANLLFSLPNTEAAMQQGQFSDEDQRVPGFDDIAGLRYAMSGLDEIQGTADDYTLCLTYAGLTTAADIVIDYDDTETGFAVSKNSGTFLSATHIAITNTAIFFNDASATWFFNQVDNMIPECGVIACPTTTTVTDGSATICSGTLGTQVSDWQDMVAAANTMGLVYSNVTPVAGSTPPDNMTPSGTIPAGCAAVDQAVSAYVYCDVDGSGTDNAGDTYTLVSSYTLTVTPEIGAPTIAVNGCSLTFTGACPGDLISLNNQSVPTGVITGDGTNSVTYTAQPGDPSGFVNVLITSGVTGSPCSFVSLEVTPACPIVCPTTTTVADGSATICSGTLGTQVSDWQNMVATANTMGLVYSSVTPVAGTTPPDNILPSGMIPAGCESMDQNVSAYVYCDVDGSGTDNAGDTYTLVSSYTLTVNPEIQAPTVMTIGCSFTITGACPNDIITLSNQTIAGGVILNNGTNSVTYTAQPGDAAGIINVNITTGTAGSACTLLSTETTPACPGCMLIVSCPSSTVNLSCSSELPDATDAEAAFIAAGGSVTASCSPAADLDFSVNDVDDGAAGCMGAPQTITRTFTISDPATGQMVDCVVDYIFEDLTDPMIDTEAMNMTVQCDGAGNTAMLNAWLANNGGAAASDNCGTVTFSNNFTTLSDDCGATGSATVTFTATNDCGRTAATAATFTIEDTTDPMIDTEAMNMTVQCDGAGNTAMLNAWLANNGGAAASDDCGGVTFSNNFSILSDDCGATGSATVTFTATDDCGRTAATTATFTIEDTTDPMIDTEAMNMTVQCDGAGNTAMLNAWLANNGGAAASDDCGTVTFSNDFTMLSDDCGATGSATVTFTAADDCGRTATTTATFTI